ncbi:hypothetical protein ACVDG8_002470 [Mesorhizobium sp. ORM8.1]
MNVSGHYIRIGRGDSAELRITASMGRPDTYHVDGLALWGKDREYGPNLGTLDFSANLDGNVIRHSESEEQGHEIVLSFAGDLLEVTEKNWSGIYGMNVNFEGKYQRASAAGGVLRSMKMAFRRMFSD